MGIANVQAHATIDTPANIVGMPFRVYMPTGNLSHLGYIVYVHVSPLCYGAYKLLSLSPISEAPLGVAKWYTYYHDYVGYIIELYICPQP